MIILLHNGQVFAPNPLGKKDILIIGDKIGAISPPGKIEIRGVNLQIIDASEKIITPGFIDSHVHILGGGGEGGPATRAPEITLEDIITSGVSTIIGCLGTDGTTRHMESLLAKARGLEEEGVTTYIFSGSYQIPVTTITGSVLSDLILIDKVIGAGEIAISDHRSSQPTFEEMARLAAGCRMPSWRNVGQQSRYSPPSCWRWSEEARDAFPTVERNRNPSHPIHSNSC